MRFPVDQIWVADDAQQSALTRRILEVNRSARVLVGAEMTEAAQRIGLVPDPLGKGKRILKLVHYKGSFVKPCPGTRMYLCCGLKILNIGQGCPIDCRYCALQAYFNNPVMEIYVNFEEMLDQLRNFLDTSPPGSFFRFCTGEFTDSLALDDYTGYSDLLTKTFAGRSNATLEFKTKTDFVAPLLRSKVTQNIIVGFSVNAPELSKSEELRATQLSKRLMAARKVASKGLRVGFHFDPIIPFQGWEAEYSKTVESIFDSVKPDSIAWISMGVLRFVSGLRDVVDSRFGPIRYFHDSYSPGLDGKLRLSRGRRIEVYRSLARLIRLHSEKVLIYLCMESSVVWKEALGLEIASNEQLAGLLDDSARSAI
ncbi:MAG: SPL family radical SAM protein [Desulfomonilaceae bacterium]